jgi:hypothetical protein
LVAFPLGIAVVLLLSAYASLFGVELTPSLVALLAIASFAAGVWRVRRIRSAVDSHTPRSTVELAVAVLPAVAIARVPLRATRTMAAKPLLEWDGWVLWATKARVLYEHPPGGAEVLQSDFYGAPSYPLGLPALQATTMRAVGHFDGTLLDLQLLALVAAVMVGVWALLHRSAHPVTIGLALLATLVSASVAYQLTTNYADVPLAFLTVLGLVAGGVWLTGSSRQTWQMVCCMLFLAAAAWTKSEGFLFSAAAVSMLVSVAVFSRREHRSALLAACGWIALVARGVPTQRQPTCKPPITTYATYSTSNCCASAPTEWYP